MPNTLLPSDCECFQMAVMCSPKCECMNCENNLTVLAKNLLAPVATSRYFQRDLPYIPPRLACYMTCNFVSLTHSLVLFLSQFYAPTVYNLYNSSSVGEAVIAHASVDRNHLFKDPLVSILSEVLFIFRPYPQE